jgi:hypothetical protein
MRFGSKNPQGAVNFSHEDFEKEGPCLDTVYGLASTEERGHMGELAG